MDENLVGYLLDALDRETQQSVESYLRSSPEGRQRLDLLRQALQPLQADRDEIEPPRGLWVQTLALIAEQRCRKLPEAPKPPANQRIPLRRSWRVADLAVAASILLCVGLLIPPALAVLNSYYQRLGCQNNLRGLGVALLSYQDLDPQLHSAKDQERGTFPNPARQPEPYNVAGFSMPLLREVGLAQDVKLICPGLATGMDGRWTARELKQLREEEFRNLAPQLIGGYSYALGYRENGQVQMRRFCDSPIPIMADSPPPDVGLVASSDRNSPNHAGRGQNILFTDGHVIYITSRFWNGSDDLFLNQLNQVAPGIDPCDVVLGASATPLK
jgi:prepilin-type processing-associated H-X9-DG protein